MGGPLVQRGLEYRIAGALDGATPAFGVERIDTLTQLVMVTIPAALGESPDAGLFDPADNEGDAESRGDRYIEWLEIRPPGLVPLGASVAIATLLLDEDGNELIPAIGPLIVLDQAGEQPTAGAGHFYTSEPLFVPQCAALQINRFPNVGGEYRVLFGVRAASTAFDEALYLEALCCLQSGILGGGGGGEGDQAIVVNTFTFSTRQAALTLGLDVYVEWSGTPVGFGAAGRAATLQILGEVFTGADKIALRPGTFTRFALLFGGTRTIRVFIEIDGVRTVVSAPTVVLATVPTVIALTAFPAWVVGDLIRIGFTDLNGPTSTVDVTAEVELTLET